MVKGRILFLNGTTSSGTTSIAKVLQEVINEPYLLVSLDAYWLTLPEKIREDEVRLREECKRSTEHTRISTNY